MEITNTNTGTTTTTITSTDTGATRFELPRWESLDLLETQTVGRLCVIENGCPLAFPINFRVARDLDDIRIVFRTVPHAAVARYEGPASLEVDSIDAATRTAWSVIARGRLRRVLGQHELPDPRPLITEGRYQWVVLDVAAISGRRFISKPASDGFTVEWQPTGN